MPGHDHSTTSAAHAGRWALDGEWLVHRCAGETRAMPVALVHAALDHAARAGAIGPDGLPDAARLCGRRGHHPRWGRWAVELRGPRWELGWYPRGQRAQRVGLVAAAAQLSRPDLAAVPADALAA